MIGNDIFCQIKNKNKKKWNIFLSESFLFIKLIWLAFYLQLHVSLVHIPAFLWIPTKIGSIFEENKMVHSNKYTI